MLSKIKSLVSSLNVSSALAGIAIGYLGHGLIKVVLDASIELVKLLLKI